MTLLTRERLLIYGALIAAAILVALFAFHESRPETEPAALEADTTRGQFTDHHVAPQQGEASVPAIIPPEPLVEGCGLRFSVTPDAKSVAPGGTVTYTAVLENHGTKSCENASFSFYYADAESFLSSSPSATASGYYWSVGTLASKDTYRVTIRTTANTGNGESLSNDACATADGAADACAENTLFVGNVPAGAVSTGTVTPLPSETAGGIVSVPSGKEYGIWIWEPPNTEGARYTASALAVAHANGFNAVYLTIDNYLKIAALPDGTAKNAKRGAYFASLASFVHIANQYGIAVDVEGGAKDWADEENRWQGYALIDFVSAYNAANPQAQVRGLQYDVESYLEPRYENDKAGTLADYVAFIAESARRMNDVNGRFSIVIPHFYDDAQAWTPSFSYGGKNAYAYTHLLDVLAQKPGSSVIVMAYRNFFDGDNGTKELASTELSEAAGTPTRVIVAQETGNVDPAYVTFNGFSKSDVLHALQNIFSNFSKETSFGGVAVHYLDPFLALR